ncbi:3-phosphoshikimate 1-carboxyvinyltransferase [Bacillus luteolus]|uniref:3-phosphoshikimate 1-carboxyvinyltransferase n=1 Tax=Litchfieldia luteola TaxID=682179 RepID=A0ABR9QP41_9BACI|nr:3-phosphoshikimate 1-carboxyvinyltransferase [Cytobacillus luteolus]MBE4910275.1 3-phosphoshikimate 1-carboxyvinyltransferase [Cytobacillus luteolus]MBP1942152.1 3-phosphoshikimate 1-carboxyvinyltransferase [Cytobacillus luteolus]
MQTKQLHTKVNKLTGVLTIPGDKSISHRAVMFGSIAKGKTTVLNFLEGEDCLSTIDCFRKMGVDISKESDSVVINGRGFEGLQEPTEILNVGNSGTTTRLLLGMLAGTPFHSCLIGDESIAKRPMKRVTNPLRDMGAFIDGREDGNYTPISIRGGTLKPIRYNSPVASAQVKSAILLAGLQCEGTTSVTEPHKSRDHTERMLRAFGGEVEENGLTCSINGGQQLRGINIHVPGDISSAAFFLVAGAIVPNSSITLHRVGLNPTRTGIIDVLKEMGADLTIENEQIEHFEPVGDINIKTSSLKGIEISGDIIPRLIDEIPIIALLATQASGDTIIKDASELKVKETNRIDTVVTELKKLGASIESTDDGMIIHGQTGKLTGTTVDSYGDHRIGMMLAIAACIAEGQMTLKDPDAIAVSYPMFFEHLNSLID